jgi:hypothetical protein
MKKITYTDLVNEWFAHLNNGYALPPYSESELNILKEIRMKYDIVEDERDSNETEPTEKRFHAASLTYMDSPSEFGKFISSKFTNGGGMEGVDMCFDQLKKLPKDAYQNVMKIIDQGTNRSLSNGTFKMGKYEKMLFEIITKTLKLSNARADQLFIAIVFSGKINDRQFIKNNIVGNDINVQGIGGIVCRNFSSIPIVECGKFSQVTVDSFNKIIQLDNIINDAQLKQSLDRDTINTSLKTIASPEIQSKLDSLMGDESDVSDVDAVDKIGNTVEQILGKSSALSIVQAFIKNYNSDISELVKNTNHWIVPDAKNYMIYISDSADIYDLLQADETDFRLPTAIVNFAGNTINVSGEKVYWKISGKKTSSDVAESKSNHLTSIEENSRAILTEIEKMKYLKEARDNNYASYSVKKDKVIANISAQKAAAFTALAKSWKELDLKVEELENKKRELNELKKDVEQRESELHQKIKDKVVSVFDDSESTMTLVVECLNSSFTLSKMTDSNRDRVVTPKGEIISTDYKRVVELLLEQNVELKDTIDKLIKESSILASDDVIKKGAQRRLSVSIGENLNEGLLDRVFKVLSTIQKMIATKLNSLNRRQNTIQKYILKITSQGV